MFIQRLCLRLNSVRHTAYISMLCTHSTVHQSLYTILYRPLRIVLHVVALVKICDCWTSLGRPNTKQCCHVIYSNLHIRRASHVCILWGQSGGHNFSWGHGTTLSRWSAPNL